MRRDTSAEPHVSHGVLMLQTAVAMMKSFAFALALVVAPSIALAGPDATAGKTEVKSALTQVEQNKLVHDHHVNEMEIQMGKLAKTKAKHADVKKYGAMLVTEHTKADKEVAALAKKKGIAKIPAETPATEAGKAEHTAMMEKMAKLETLKGAEFDTMFLQLMVEGHDKEVALNTAAASAVVDADVKAWVEKRGESLAKHATAARDLQAKTAVSTK